MGNAAIYTRISSDPTGQRLGVQRQEEECRALCDRNGWAVEAVFEDDDRSAYSGKPRPGYRRLMEAIAALRVDMVVSWAPDRLHRSPRELEDFIDLVDTSGVGVHTVQSGDWNLSTSDGRMAARVVGAVARGESERKSERAKAKSRQLAAAGKVGGGGSRPFGYAADRVTIVPAEAVLVREAMNRFLAGASLRSICADWNQRSIDTVAGGPWRTQVLRRLLGSPRIAGWREHRGDLVAEAEWDGIVSLDDHHAARAILDDPARMKHRGGRRYLLTGVLRCTLCEAAMVARPTQDRRRKYVCATGPDFVGCGRLAALAEPIEEFVTAAVLSGITDMGPPPAPVLVDTAERDDVAARLDQLATMFAEGAITKREWLAARDGLDRRLGALQAAETDRLGQRAAHADIAALRATPDAWGDLDIDRQRAVIGSWVDTVWLRPAVRGRNRFDPDRVTIDWH